MPDYLKKMLYLSKEFADVYAYLSEMQNYSRYICLLVRADMARDPQERFKAALQADLIRLEKKN